MRQHKETGELVQVVVWDADVQYKTADGKVHEMPAHQFNNTFEDSEETDFPAKDKAGKEPAK